MPPSSAIRQPKKGSAISSSGKIERDPHLDHQRPDHRHVLGVVPDVSDQGEVLERLARPGVALPRPVEPAAGGAHDLVPEQRGEDDPECDRRGVWKPETGDAPDQESAVGLPPAGVGKRQHVAAENEEDDDRGLSVDEPVEWAEADQVGGGESVRATGGVEHGKGHRQVGEDDDDGRQPADGVELTQPSPRTRFPRWSLIVGHTSPDSGN